MISFLTWSTTPLFNNRVERIAWIGWLEHFALYTTLDWIIVLMYRTDHPSARQRSINRKVKNNTHEHGHKSRRSSFPTGKCVDFLCSSHKRPEKTINNHHTNGRRLLFYIGCVKASSKTIYYCWVSSSWLSLYSQLGSAWLPCWNISTLIILVDK